MVLVYFTIHVSTDGCHQKSFHFQRYFHVLQNEFYVTHQYFLTKRSIYLVIFKITDGRKCLSELQQWLVNIQVSLKIKQDVKIVARSQVCEFTIFTAVYLQYYFLKKYKEPSLINAVLGLHHSQGMWWLVSMIAFVQFLGKTVSTAE